MNNAQLSLLSGLSLIILSKVTFNGLGGFIAFLGIVGVLYYLFVEGVNLWASIQAKSKPPFGMNAQLFFDTLEERNSFTEKLTGLIQDVRREKDATNGLTPEQLAQAGVAADGSSPAEDATPARPTRIAPDQIWKDNDVRSNRVVRVLSVAGSVDGYRANVVNTATGRRSSIAAANLLKTGKRGYSFEGIAE